MAITINTYCRVNRNGSININTDPSFLFANTTSTTTTTTTINPNDYACVEVGSDESYEFNGTYVATGTSTVGGTTRPVYTNTNGQGASIQLADVGFGTVWAIQFGGFDYASTTQPVPTYPWQATGYSLDLRRLTQGPC